MRHLLAVTLAGAALAVPVAAPAHAAALKKSCNMVSDASDDVYVFDKATGVKASALDIRSVDVATGRTKLVGVMRLGAPVSASDNTLANGGSWSLDFRFAKSDTQYTFQKTMARPAQGGAVTYAFQIDHQTVAGVVGTTDGATITWTIAKSLVPPLKKPKATVVKMFSSTLGFLSHDYAPDGGTFADVKYQDMQSSCVRAT